MDVLSCLGVADDITWDVVCRVLTLTDYLKEMSDYLAGFEAQRHVEQTAANRAKRALLF